MIHAESDMARDQMMKDLFDCVDFANSSTSHACHVPSVLTRLYSNSPEYVADPLAIQFRR